MKKTALIALLFVLIALLGFGSEASAQVGSSKPGFSAPVKNSVPTPIGKTGIILKILDGYGQPVREATLTVLPVRVNPLTNEQYVDLGSAKKYSYCDPGSTIGCVTLDGLAEIPFFMLPLDNSGQYADVIVRAEAPNGFVHGVWDMRRVYVQANRPEYLGTIYMYDTGFSTPQTIIWWESKEIFVIGVLVNSPQVMDVSLGFSFKGTSFTKTSVNYGQLNATEHLDEGWNWIERRFYAPQTNMKYYNGSFCGEMQITSPYIPEWVYGKTKDLCLAER